MWLIVGLGNPGAQYEKTRHNIGFGVIEYLAQKHHFGEFKNNLKALSSKGSIQDQSVVLCMPQTFMNLSGDAVGALMRFFKVSASNIIVVHDELDFALGQFKIKVSGGHGGHNGLRSVSQHCSPDYIRVRMGIGKPAHASVGAQFVLSPFSGAEQPVVQTMTEQAAQAIEDILSLGVQTAMGRWNQALK